MLTVMLNLVLLDACFDLINREILVPAKMKIVLSSISDSLDNVKEVMEKVDADVSRLPSNSAAVTGTVSTLGKVLQLTKNIMDKLAQV